MDKTLVTYKDLGHDPIVIDDYCVVQVYKNEIALSNAEGYFIQPLNGLTNPKQTIEERVRKIGNPDNFEHLVILAGRRLDSFSRRIIYAVWYNGDIEPTYPARPTIEVLPEPDDRFNLFSSNKITNRGAKTNCKVTLTLGRTDIPVEFYINGDYFIIDVSKETPQLENVLVVDSTGVTYNSLPIDTFDLETNPSLDNGENVIRVLKSAVKKVKVEYMLKF